MLKKELTINDLAKIIEKQNTKMDERFEKQDKRFEKQDKRFEKQDERFEKMEKRIDKRFEKMDNKIDDLITITKNSFEEQDKRIDKKFAEQDKKINSLKQTMVTKDYLDEKLSDLRGDLVVLTRKEDTKIKTLVNILSRNNTISEKDKEEIMAMEPFPEIKLNS